MLARVVGARKSGALWAGTLVQHSSEGYLAPHLDYCECHVGTYLLSVSQGIGLSVLVLFDCVWLTGASLDVVGQFYA